MYFDQHFYSSKNLSKLSKSNSVRKWINSYNARSYNTAMLGYVHCPSNLKILRRIELLRELHGRMQDVVFAHRGTVDKYIGDAMMATFGTPIAGTSDACDALSAAVGLHDAIARWNRSRATRGEAPVRIGVGVHHGPVVLGDIGGASRLEFAVLGDTVNVASRLEHATRVLDAPIVASDAIVRAARAENVAGADVLARFAPGPAQTLPGRAEPVAVWLAR